MWRGIESDLEEMLEWQARNLVFTKQLSTIIKGIWLGKTKQNGHSSQEWQSTIEI